MKKQKLLIIDINNKFTLNCMNYCLIEFNYYR